MHSSASRVAARAIRMEMHMTIPSAPFGAAARDREKTETNIAAEGKPRTGGPVKGFVTRRCRDVVAALAGP